MDTQVMNNENEVMVQNWSMFLNLAARCDELLLDIGRCSSVRLESHILNKLKQMPSRANKPFKMGLVGEFRTGKSSLINVLANYNAALVDELETTASLNRYYYSDQENVIISYFDGRKSEAYSLSDANVIMDERRHDAEWLETIEEISFGIPSPSLHDVEIWDTPGISGSAFNAGIANRFVDEVNAAIWVFDVNYLGKSSISPILEKLAKRGTQVIGVINKCEDLISIEIEEAEKLVRRSYPSVSFANIVACSAQMAREYQTYGDSYLALGDLPKDGNYNQLSQVIYDSAITPSRQLVFDSSVGDFLGILGEVDDALHQAMLDISRKRYLLEEYAVETTHKISKRFAVLSNDLHHDLRMHLIASFTTEITEYIHKSPDDIQKLQLFEKQIRNIFNEQSIQKKCAEFISSQKSRILAIIESFKGEQYSWAYQELTPEEVRIRLQSSAIPDISASVDNKRDSLASVILDKSSWAIGGTAMYLWIIPGFNYMALFGGLFAGLCQIVRKVIKNSSAESERHKIQGKVNEQIIETLNKISPALKQIVLDQTDLVATNTYQALYETQEKIVFLDTPKEQALSEQMYCEQMRNKIMHLSQEANLLFSTVSHQYSTPLLQTSIQWNSTEPEKGVQILQAIFAQATDTVSITDGDLSPHVMRYLADVKEHTNIRLLTWTNALAATMSQYFAEALGELRSHRSGGVTVVTPKATDLISAVKESLPQGTWIFTRQGAYYFDRPLIEVLRPSSNTVTFTPYDDSGKLFEQKFGRWWSGNAPGYQAIRFG